MLNQVVLVGVVDELQPRLNHIMLRIEDKENIQLIPIYIPNTLADQTNDYLHLGATIGISGKIESDFGENLLIVVGKMTFIKSAT